jgi:hypothetical protein
MARLRPRDRGRDPRAAEGARRRRPGARGPPDPLPEPRQDAGDPAGPIPVRPLPGPAQPPRRGEHAVREGAAHRPLFPVGAPRHGDHLRAPPEVRRRRPRVPPRARAQPVVPALDGAARGVPDPARAVRRRRSRPGEAHRAQPERRADLDDAREAPLPARSLRRSRQRLPDGVGKAPRPRRGTATAGLLAQEGEQVQGGSGRLRRDAEGQPQGLGRAHGPRRVVLPDRREPRRGRRIPEGARELAGRSDAREPERREGADRASSRRSRSATRG